MSGVVIYHSVGTSNCSGIIHRIQPLIIFFTSFRQPGCRKIKLVINCFVCNRSRQHSFSVTYLKDRIYIYILIEIFDLDLGCIAIRIIDLKSAITATGFRPRHQCLNLILSNLISSRNSADIKIPSIAGIKKFSRQRIIISYFAVGLNCYYSVGIICVLGILISGQILF